MIKRLNMLLLLLICAGAGASHASESEVLENIESSARTWLALTDNGQYVESWRNASSLFQEKLPESDWLETIGAAKSSLGSVKNRYIASAGRTDTLSGSPDGEYVVVQFYTTFENRALALETVTVVKDQKEIWRVAEYAIK